MALSKEEIAIRVGVDSRAISPGLAGASRQINKFADDSIKKLNSILKANVFLAAADLFRQLIPSAQEFWEKYYGADEESLRMADEAHARIKSLAKAIEDSRKSVEKAKAKDEFDKADKPGKFLLLMAGRREAIEEQDRQQKEEERLFARSKILRDRINRADEDLKEIEASTPMDAKQMAKKIITETELKKKLYKLDRDLVDNTKRLADAKIAKNAATERELELEGRLRGLREAKPPEIIPNAAPENLKPYSPMDGVNKYLDGIKKASDDYKEKTDYSKWGQAVKEGQIAAAKEVVQKVSIVEIKE